MHKSILPAVLSFVLAAGFGNVTANNHTGDPVGKKQHQITRSTLGSAGSSTTFTHKSGTYSLCQSVGQESVTGTFSRKGCFLLQGYEQPPGISLNIPRENYLQALMYPNPFFETVTVTFDIIVIDRIFVTVYDIRGTAVYQQEFPASQSIILPLKDFSNGTYFVKILIDNHIFTSTLIKQQQ